MAKRHAENISIGDALKEFIDANRLEKGLDKVNAKAQKSINQVFPKLRKGKNHQIAE